MTNDQTLAPEEESNPKWQIKQTKEIEEDKKIDTTEAVTTKQEDSAENPAKDSQTIYASNRKEDLGPPYEIVLERKTRDTTEPHMSQCQIQRERRKRQKPSILSLWRNKE